MLFRSAINDIGSGDTGSGSATIAAPETVKSPTSAPALQVIVSPSTASVQSGGEVTVRFTLAINCKAGADEPKPL